jgi:hypothetical protein
MKTIYKYPLTAVTRVELPEGSKLLTVQLQQGIPTLWALIDTTRPPTTRTIVLAPTGHTLDENFNDYLATVQMPDGFVWHAFEVKP